MKKRKLKKIESLFKKKKTLVRQTNEVGRNLDFLINEMWGFHYSETDDDPIIDTLDCGIYDISFETFLRKMNGYKKNIEENNGKFGIVY